MKNIDVLKKEKFHVPKLQIYCEFRPSPHPYNCGYHNWSPFLLNGADFRSIYIECFFKYNGDGRSRHINRKYFRKYKPTYSTQKMPTYVSYLLVLCR